MNLTDRQQQILGYLESCQREGYTPTLQEVADHTDTKSASGIHYQYRQLEAKGYIELAKRGKKVTVR